MLDHRLQVLTLGGHCAVPSSDPECFGKIIVNYDLFAAAVAHRAVLWFDRAKRAAIATGAAALLAFFFNLDHVRRLVPQGRGEAPRILGCEAARSQMRFCAKCRFSGCIRLSPYRCRDHRECSTS